MGGFWALSPPSMTWVCWNFNQRYFSHNTKTVSEQFFKIKCLRGNGTYPKLTVLIHFWVQFNPRKSKILPNTKIFPEITSLWLSNNRSPRSQINHRILIKLIKKILGGAKNGLFKVKNNPVNKDQEVRRQVSTKFLEASNSRLTFGEFVFVVAKSKLPLFQF